jgi:hypothetical protein
MGESWGVEFWRVLSSLRSLGPDRKSFYGRAFIMSGNEVSRDCGIVGCAEVLWGTGPWLGYVVNMVINNMNARLN